MKNLFLLIVTSVLCTSAIAQDISGNWKGEIDLNGTPLEIGFKINNSESGYEATIDIPKQGLSNAKVASTTFVDSVLNMNLPEYGISYKGKLSSDDIFIGHLSQGTNAIKLTLSKGEIVLNRPQEPKAPFNYNTEEVVFSNEESGLKLSGTLTTPKKKGKFPVAIIVSGSGPQDRDGFMFGHKPYLLLADELTQKGIAVLRFDERGVGESEGDFESATLNDFIADVEVAMGYLKSRKDINKKKVGLIGHSIGGIIAPRIAAKSKDVSFLVLMAAPGVPGPQLMLSQKASMERLMGVNEIQITQGQTLFKGAYDIIANSEADKAETKIAVQAYFRETFGPQISSAQIKDITDQITSNELMAILQNKPDTYLTEVSCPVLAINGSKDFQVSAEENLAGIEEGLTAGGNENVEIITFENLNHLFQTSNTGSLNEYSEIEETMAPEVLDTVTEWILGVVK